MLEIMNPSDESTRLAVYGTLAPGQCNHHIIAPLRGSWTEGSVRGVLHNAEWVTAGGFPSFTHDPNGALVPVQVLESADLPRHWERLDQFEGSEYRRIVVPVETANGIVQANIYTTSK